MVSMCGCGPPPPVPVGPVGRPREAGPRPGQRHVCPRATYASLYRDTDRPTWAPHNTFKVQTLCGQWRLVSTSCMFRHTLTFDVWVRWRRWVHLSPLLLLLIQGFISAPGIVVVHIHILQNAGVYHHQHMALAATWHINTNATRGLLSLLTLGAFACTISNVWLVIFSWSCHSCFMC